MGDIFSSFAFDGMGSISDGVKSFGSDVKVGLETASTNYKDAMENGCMNIRRGMERGAEDMRNALSQSATVWSQGAVKAAWTIGSSMERSALILNNGAFGAADGLKDGMLGLSTAAVGAASEVRRGMETSAFQMRQGAERLADSIENTGKELRSGAVETTDLFWNRIDQSILTLSKCLILIVVLLIAGNLAVVYIRARMNPVPNSDRPVSPVVNLQSKEPTSKVGTSSYLWNCLLSGICTAVALIIIFRLIPFGDLLRTWRTKIRRLPRIERSLDERDSRNNVE